MNMPDRIGGIGSGDIVLCQDLTFSATCNSIVYQGAIPVFVDSERESWNMDLIVLRRAFGQYPQAKAVMVVNLYGTSAKRQSVSEDIFNRGLCLPSDIKNTEEDMERIIGIVRGVLRKR